MSLYKKPLVIHPDSRCVFVLESLDESGEISQKLIEYADLIQAPEQVHTYKISPYALWTAKGKGVKSHEVISFLEENLQNILSESFRNTIQNDMDHFGALEFSIEEDNLYLNSKTKELIDKIKEIEYIKNKIIRTPNPYTLMFKARYRKDIKKILFEHNLFVKDIVYLIGDELDIKCTNPHVFDYQLDAINSYLEYNHKAGGGGTIIMPPNSGKIAVGLKIIEALKTSTLIIAEDKYKVEKWRKEIIKNTDISEQNISIFEEEGAELKPITIGTYDILCNHINQLYGFGFVIYDDAHNIPTPTHERTVDIKSKYKLALASTLARSDGNGYLVLSLIGPKWYEVLYKTLVNKKYLVPVKCVEVKIPLPEDEWQDYLKRNSRDRVNADTLNSNKYKAVSILLKKEVTKRMLIVSYFNEMITNISRYVEVPALSSQLNQENRQRLISSFNKKEIDKLITPSKLIEHIPFKMVDVIIALSHQQGSEREEYLRIGKLLPVDDCKRGAVLYSLVSQNTDEERFYSKRRRKLINQGFPYKILTFQDLMERGEFFES